MNNVKMSVSVLFVIMFVYVYSFAHQPNVTDPSRPPPPWVLQVSYITLLQFMSCVPSCRLLDIYSCLLMSIRSQVHTINVAWLEYTYNWSGVKFLKLCCCFSCCCCCCCCFIDSNKNRPLLWPSFQNNPFELVPNPFRNCLYFQCRHNLLISPYAANYCIILI